MAVILEDIYRLSKIFRRSQHYLRVIVFPFPPVTAGTAAAEIEQAATLGTAGPLVVVTLCHGS